ncbi:1-deoxy-D-xylulose-5-phosphate synthase [Paraburkholderia piptadeniae]|uniref:Transketolase family protein n=2 Tax=Paraburkholderia TaxID=1822464 RepID=A0A7X1NC20_9BURK|nr:MULTISPECIES: transketolase C-terminal domain-containing protein [Paraburkholderia]MPW18771.1 transketolase family protein [Paraburkholderia franconis]SIT48177.1 1-deoxy-D-xylulose-5-phosphate synthase [Paraburkholderia piptadeniae]
MREAFSNSLIRLGAERQDLVVLDGDCSHSTRTYRFQDAYPQRFINAGIAEQNMVGMAAGMAKAGLVPIVCGFAAIMVHRAADQLVQSLAYAGTNVKLVGHYAGVTASSEGAPHHSIADLALVRSIPNMTILCPADDGEVESCLRQALDITGPVYLRLARNPVPVRPDVSWVIRDGYQQTRSDGGIVIVSIGVMLDVAVQTAAQLNSLGVVTSVVALQRLKPLPHELSEALASDRWSLIVTIEDHNVVGGLGGAIAEAVGHKGKPVLRYGIEDMFTQSGTYDELLSGLNLRAADIAGSIVHAVEARDVKEPM